MDVSDDADRLQTLLYSSYSADIVRQLERPLLDDGVPLMRMAASAVARVTLSLLDDEDLDVEDARVTVLAEMCIRDRAVAIGACTPIVLRLADTAPPPKPTSTPAAPVRIKCNAAV